MQLKSILPPFTDSLCVSLGVIKTIFCAKSLCSGLCGSLLLNWMQFSEGVVGRGRGNGASSQISLVARTLPSLCQWQPEFPGFGQQPFQGSGSAPLVCLVEAFRAILLYVTEGTPTAKFHHPLFVFAVCSLPPEPENGGYVCHPRPCRDPLNSGSVIEYLCAEGYMLKGDYKYLTCKNGEWKPAMEISCHLNEGQFGR